MFVITYVDLCVTIKFVKTKIVKKNKNLQFIKVVFTKCNNY